MIETYFLRSLINEDEDLANEIWTNDNQRLQLVLRKTRLKDFFLRLLASKNNQVGKNINQYLEEKKLKHLIKEGFIRNLSAELREDEINHIVFKGAIQSKLYYNNSVDRDYSDFDILIKNDSYERVYDFFNKRKFKHSNNLQYINRLGFCRTALEVIDTDYGALDIHHRVFSKFYRKNCDISDESFLHHQVTDNMSHTSNELNLCIVLYHAYKQNNLIIDPYYLIDFYKIYSAKNINHRELNKYLEKFKLNAAFDYCLRLINSLNTEENRVKKLFKISKNSRYRLSNFAIRTQINQFFDPLPYMYLKTGGKHFSYIDFLILKSKKLFLVLRK